MWWTNLLLTISMILWIIGIPVYLIDEWNGKRRLWPSIVLLNSAVIGSIVLILEGI